MASAGLRFEDRLNGASNFYPWRERIGLVLEENGLLEIVEGKVTATADPIQPVLSEPAQSNKSTNQTSLRGKNDRTDSTELFLTSSILNRLVPYLFRPKTWNRPVLNSSA